MLEQHYTIKMAYKRKPKTNELIKKIKEARGNVSAISRAYFVSRQTVYDWIEESAEAKQALTDERFAMVDTAVSKLAEKIDEGDNSAIFYMLNNSPEAKQMGWGNRIEHTGAEGGIIRITVTNDTE